MTNNTADPFMGNSTTYTLPSFQLVGMQNTTIQDLL